MERPEIIGKLATYLQDKEPLIYLFILNSVFIPMDEKTESFALAGVEFKNKKIIFHCSKRLFQLKPEQLYFIILHEAFHIFKKHLESLKEIAKEDPITTNVSADAIINNLIISANYNYDLKPEQVPGTIVLPKRFIEENKGNKFGRNGYTTKRLYKWYKEQEQKRKESLLQVGSYVLTKDNKLGKITNKNGNNYEVEERNINDIRKEFNGENIEKKNTENFSSNDLTPVSFTNYEKGTIFGGSIDKHINNYSDYDKNEIREFTKRLIQESKKINKSAGNDHNSITKKIEELLEPKVEWNKILRKHLNIFVTKNSFVNDTKKSFITYPWNPKSRYGILCKHYIEKKANIQTYFILAIDTSGSIFFNNEELQLFFSEIEAMAKWLKFTKKGQILTLQWDTEIKQKISLYEKDMWKQLPITGGGGTTPEVVFQYLSQIYKKKNGYYFVKENGIEFIIQNKLPFLIFLTDGFFFEKLTKNKLLVYTDSVKEILFFTKNTSSINIEGVQTILYE